VLDSQGPVYKSVPALAPVTTTSPDGAIVTYDRPLAFDNIDQAYVQVACDPPSSSLFPVGTTDVTCTATDAHGNESISTILVTVAPPADSTPPVIAVPPPAEVTVAATSASGATVTYQIAATDNADTGAIEVTCDRPSGSTFAIGTTLVTCTATDAAGNRTTTSFTVTVPVSWSFFLQPINSDGTSIFKQGSTVPVKFRLTGASAGITNLDATIRVQKVANNITGSELETVVATTADSGTTFRYDPVAGIYIFNLSTTGLQAGTYSVSVGVGTVVLGTVRISIKK
jgi:hypothetical protein